MVLLPLACISRRSSALAARTGIGALADPLRQTRAVHVTAHRADAVEASRSLQSLADRVALYYEDTRLAA
jgi:hypothetical protein